jgi:hypothetical protein
VDGNFAYSSQLGGAMSIFDVTNPLAPVKVGGGGGFFAGGYLQVANGFAYIAGIGFNVFDVSNPAALVQRGSLPISGPTCVALHGTYAYVGSSAGISVVNISSPDAPAIVGSVPA